MNALFSPRSHWLPRRLTTRVTLSMIIIVVLAGLVTMAVLNRLVWWHLRAELITSGDALVQATGENLANALVNGDLAAIQESLNSTVNNNRDVVYAFAFTPRTPIVHTFTGGFPSDLLQIVTTTGQERATNVLLQTEDRLIRDFSYRPLDGLPAEVHLGINQARIGTVQRQITSFMLLLTAAGGALAATVAYGFSRLAVNPLAELTEQVQRLGKGHLDERLDLVPGDEVGDLAQAFNRMAADIQDAMEQLQISEAGYRDLLRAASAVGESIALICDEGPEEGRFLFVNEAFARLAGFTPEGLGGMNAATVLHPRSLQNARSNWNLIRAGSGQAPLELILVDRQGQSHVLETSGTIIEYEGRRALAWFARDISERKAREEEVRHRNRELTALNAVAAATSELMPADVMLASALEQVLEALALYGGWILLPDEDGCFQLVTSAGLSSKVAPAFPTCRCGDVIRDGRPRIVSGNRPECLIRQLETTNGTRLEHHATVPLRARGRVLGALSVATANPQTFTEAEMALLTAVGQQIGVALESARLWQELRDKERVRSELLGRVINAQEEERQRMARELHDGIGQSLNALVVGLNTVDAAVNRSPGSIPELLRRLRISASDTVKELQTIIYDLRPSLLDDLGLVRAVHWYAQERLEPLGISVSFDAPTENLCLSPEGETGLFRIAQEALTNIGKHAEAQQVTIRLWTDNNRVFMEVTDDGTGFTVSRPSQPELGDGWGLLGMQERAGLLGGNLTIESQPGHGTRVRIMLPMETPVEVTAYDPHSNR